MECQYHENSEFCLQIAGYKYTVTQVGQVLPSKYKPCNRLMQKQEEDAG